MNKAKKTEEVALPFDLPEFSLKWQEWLQFRKERRLPSYVPTGLKKTFTKLVNESQGDPCVAMQIIDQAIANNWQGLHPLKPNYGNTNSGIVKKPIPTGNVTKGGFGQL